MKRSALLAWAAAGGVAVLLASWWNDDDREVEGLLEDRIWLDRLPEKKEDEVQVALFLRGGEDAGDFDGTTALAKGSSFRGDFERYRWKSLGAKKLKIEPLPRGRGTEVTFEASECKEDGFHYCLTVEGLPRGPKRYRSKRGWEVEPGGNVDAAMARAREEVPRP
jgi:hypothetical protein